MKKLPILILSTAMLAASTLPSLAAPIYAEADTVSQPRVIQVDDNWRHHGDYRHSDWHGDRRDWRDDNHHHHHHGNAGAIIGGLAAGAIIGGALAAPERRDRYYDDSY